MAFCTNCGKKLEAGSKFCPSCGQRVEIEDLKKLKEQSVKGKEAEENYKINETEIKEKDNTKELKDILDTIKFSDDNVTDGTKPIEKEIAKSKLPEKKENKKEIEPEKTYYKKDEGGKYFSAAGRLNRQSYLLRSLFLFLLMLVGGALATIVIGFVIIIPAFIANILLNIRRCHDLDLSGWWSIGCLIPYLNVVFYLYLMIKKGTTGPNKYGPDPLQESVK